MLCVSTLMLAGCTGSRWARDDVDYARKYAEHTDNPVRVAKQAIDARHVVGKHGVYGGFAGRAEPFGAGVEAGAFAYPRSWLETRLGGAMLAHEGERPLSGGGILGARVQPPTRLAPFAGVGGYLGWAGWEDASADMIDNDDDGFIDESGEDDLAFVAAVVPEVGLHYWITSRLRLTGSADYRLMTSGRESDSLYYGVSLAWLSPGQSSPRKQHKADDRDWTFGNDADAWKDATLPNGPAPVIQPPEPATKRPETRGEAVKAVASAIGDAIESR